MIWKILRASTTTSCQRAWAKGATKTRPGISFGTWWYWIWRTSLLPSAKVRHVFTTSTCDWGTLRGGSRKPRVLRSPRSEVILGECPRGAPRGAPRICDERCCAHSVIVGDCRWGWQNNKNDSDNNNGNDDDSINNNSKQKQQQLRIHVRRIPLGGFPLLPFNPALGERPRVPRRGHPAVLSASESLLAEASRWKPVG